MLSATLYIITCSAKNRVRRRLQRLREPRYLLGAVVGIAYLYFAVFGRMRFTSEASRQRPIPAAFLPTIGGGGPMFAGLALLTGAALSLAVPMGSAMLDFSRTESEFLFPSPLSRRQLVLYRLMRSQWAVLFSALVIALTFPLATPSARLRSFIGSWLALMTCHVFFTGVTLTRARISSPSIRARLLVWVPRGLLCAGILAIIGSAFGTATTEGAAVESAGDLIRLLSTTCASGLPSLVLWPFIAVARPLAAQSFAAFVMALPAALLVYAVVIAWVLAADEAFDAMADSLVETRHQRARPGLSYRMRATPWTLSPRGRLELLFVWKTATQTLRVVSPRLLVRVLLIVGSMTIGLMLLTVRNRGLGQIGSVFAAANVLFAIVFGPQIFRFDLREDLQHLELLKTWPLRAAALIRGQMIGAAAVVTAVAWGFGVLALLLSAVSFTRTDADFRMAGGVAVLILAPALILAQYTVHNAAALFFPAWLVGGSRKPRGIDAMGQRIIMLGGTWVVLLVAILPAAIISGVMWFTLGQTVGPWILVPSAVLAALVVFAEVALASEALAPVYERLDVTSVEPIER